MAHDAAAPDTRTLAEVWRAAVAAPPVETPFLVREPGGWRAVGWPEAAQAVDEIAAGFLALGVRRGDRVGLLARTRLEWTLCDWALISIGAPVVPIYPTTSADDCVYLLGDSAARFLVCEDADQLEKVAGGRAELPSLEGVVAIEECDGATPLAAVRERGREHLAAHPDAVAEARSAIRESDLLTIVYTSGTSGPPKGCSLTHRNYWVSADMVRRVEGLVVPGDRTVLHLPLAHVFGRLVEFVGASIGITIAYCPDTSTVPAALREVKPTLFTSVPRLYAKVAAAVEGRLAEGSPARRALIRFALRAGSEASEAREAGRRLPLGLRLRLRLADRLVLAKIRDRLGGELRLAVSGGAPLPREIAQFFHTLGVLLLEGYGLTECTTVASVNRPGRYRLGTIGLAIPDVELAIAPDGEILVRGENVFAGYYGDEEATRAVISEDGWLATGDLGELDADGFLTITGRKKDIIVTGAGKNISPQNIEVALTASPYIVEAVVVGDGRPYLVALLDLDRDEVARVASSEADIERLIQSAVDGVNGRLGEAERIRRFAVLSRSLSLERRELTPTLKVRRRVAEENFRDEIEAMYGRV